jgi:SAM-dependent methyltransferase
MSGNIHCKGDWFNLVCESYTAVECQYLGKKLPRFPADEIQINTTGQSGCDTLCEAFIFYDDCLKCFEKSKNFNNDNKVIMDFGVGWGRILRFFLRDFKPEDMVGVDINPELLDICKSTFDFGKFIRSNAMPPLDIGDESTDFIVGYSVFSHLSEDVCYAWMKEFSRILKPGGMLALTTRGRWFFDYCDSLKLQEGYSGALAYMFDDFGKARDEYDSGKIVHTSGNGISGGGVLNESFYGETFIPESYAKEKYSNLLDFVKFEYVAGRQMHPIMFFRKS